MLSDYSAQRVSLSVLTELEARRAELVASDAGACAAIDAALAPIERDYLESELPPDYFRAVAELVRAALMARWLPMARDFTDKERRRFGLWRGGDPIARMTWLLGGLLLGSFIIWAPFIPIWADWVPLFLSVCAFFVPDAQIAWHRRLYARALGDLSLSLAASQPRLDEHLYRELPEPGRQQAATDMQAEAPPHDETDTH